MKALPTLKQLRYLSALADHLHFGQAAEACHVTQSTLSAGIQELETLLDAPLVDRTKRSVMFTPLGEDIVARGRAILRAAEDLVSLADAAREPLTGVLRLGVIPTIGPYLLPRLLPGLRARHPRLRLYLREEQTQRLIDRLLAGEIDLALLALPYPCGDVETRVLGRDSFQVALPKDHPLAALDAVPVARLATEPLLLLEDGHCLRDHALAACAFEGARQRGPFEATSLMTLVQMVANGLGVTLVPSLAVSAGLLAGTDVVARPLEDARAAREIGLVWRRGAGRRVEFQAFADALEAGLAEAAESPSPAPPSPARGRGAKARP
jgi:LysR family hydrogen peroxide-inducible transcriptional activator